MRSHERLRKAPGGAPQPGEEGKKKKVSHQTTGSERDWKGEDKMRKVGACLAAAPVAIAVVVALGVASPLVAAENPAEHSQVSSGVAGSALGALQIAKPSSGLMLATTQGGTPPNCGELKCSECFFLDVYDPSHTVNAPAGSPWVIGPATSAGYLANGQWYIVTISGDVSYWAQDTSNTPNWTSNPGTWTGTPGNPPRYPSPGTTNGYTGFDWEYIFAVPYTLVYPQPDTSFPHHLPLEGISVNGPGGPFADYVPIGGQSYHPDHVYKYFVQGQGQPISIRTTDTGPTSDNSGQYKICVQAVCGSDGTDVPD
jgi:hypothetical protein